ncbi:hypothetical protein DESC_710075 [Desulfosarcina cetonica]|nr:hypothetical protein DESC_710075 [Desulfosarcina cetonica]
MRRYQHGVQQAYGFAGQLLSVVPCEIIFWVRVYRQGIIIKSYLRCDKSCFFRAIYCEALSIGAVIHL